MRSAVVAVFLAVACILTVPLRADSIPNVTISLHAPVGYQMNASTPPTSVGGFDITSIVGPSLLLGHFDQYGNVQGGDAVLVAYIDLGTAPIPAAQFGSSYVTPADPIASSSYAVDLPLALYEVSLFLWSDANMPPDGTSGTMYLSLALLDNANESLNDALGVTVPFEVAVGQPGYIFGDSGVYQYTQFTRGGAERFASVPEPSSVLLLGGGIIGILSTWRKKRTTS